jgi:hypothetical protein
MRFNKRCGYGISMTGKDLRTLHPNKRMMSTEEEWVGKK